jgi:hypothetical protein
MRSLAPSEIAGLLTLGAIFLTIVVVLVLCITWRERSDGDG